MSNTQTLTSEDFHATIDGEKPGTGRLLGGVVRAL